MSFFKKDKPKTQQHSKRKAGKSESSITSKRNKKQYNEDDITSEESEAEIDAKYPGQKAPDYSSSESDDETADQKRKRLAEEHLEQLKHYVASDDDDDNEDGDYIAKRLHKENLAKRGRLHREVASQYIEPTSEDITVCRGHALPVTCVVLCPDNQHAFTASKDCSIIKWNIETGKKERLIACGKKDASGHTAHILCLAISSDGRYLASGDLDHVIHIRNAETCELLHTTSMHKHRAAVSGLIFRLGTHELFSSSFDRTVKVWNVSEAGIVYVETLFGHQDIITAIDALSLGRVVTSGAKDGSVRVWKIVEESQLVFHGHSGSIDCVCYIDDNHFFSGADDSSIALWSTMKKKPLVTVKNAHNGKSSADCDIVNESAVYNGDNWITAVAALHNTDLVVSGSKDGFIRFWKCGQDYKMLTPLFSLPITGTVNSLRFSSNGQLLVAGIGREHKLGRWWCNKQATNSLAIIRLKKTPRKDQ